MQQASNPVVRAGVRTASVIGALKVTLLVINAAVGVSLIVIGFMARPDGTATVFEGQEFVQPDAGTTLWWVFVAVGANVLAIGSVLIFAILGWLEHMLRVSAEHLAVSVAPFTATPLPLGNVAGEIQTAPMNWPSQ